MKTNRTVAPLLKAVAALRADHLDKEEAFLAAEEAYRAKLTELRKSLKPLVNEAIAEYNGKESLAIVAERTTMNFNFTEKKLKLTIRMSYPTGHEPDEEFTFKDEDRVSKKLGRYLNPKLKNARIPLKFEKASFPIDYFQK